MLANRRRNVVMTDPHRFATHGHFEFCNITDGYFSADSSIHKMDGLTYTLRTGDGDLIAALCDVLQGSLEQRRQVSLGQFDKIAVRRTD